MDIASWYSLLCAGIIAADTEPALGIIDYISRGGFIVMLLVIIYGGMKRWWVFGWLYLQEREEKNEWKEIALRTQNIANTSTAIGEKLIERKLKETP